MPKLRLLLASLLGALAAAVVMCWPTMPLWQGERGYVLGFSPEGGTLFAIHGATERPKIMPTATVAGGRFPKSLGDVPGYWLGAWDARSGEPRRKTKLDWPTEQRIVPFSMAPRYEASPDGDAVLVGYQAGISGVPGGTMYEAMLFDGATGARRGKVFSYRHLNPGCFSPDSRWFWTYVGDQLEGVEIRDAKNGERVLQLIAPKAPPAVPVRGPAPSGERRTRWSDCCFAKDGSRVWVRHHDPFQDAGRQTRLCCFALPSGAALREIWIDATQAERRVRPCRVEQDRLLVQRSESPDPKAPGTYFIRTYALDLKQEKPELGQPLPGLEGHVDGKTREQNIVGLQDGWIGHWRYFFNHEETALEKAQVWARARLGLQLPTESKDRVGLKIYDAQTRVLLAEQILPSATVEVSPDARYAAMAHKDTGTIMVWAVQPAPRWPWALAAGLAPLALCLLPRRRPPTAPKRNAQELPKDGANAP